MSFPLFDVKKLEEKPTAAVAKQQEGPAVLSYGACPSDPPKPTTYLRDIVVVLLVLAFLLGIVVLAYRLPSWL
jgi:hypothetical protein